MEQSLGKAIEDLALTIIHEERAKANDAIMRALCSTTVILASELAEFIQPSDPARAQRLRTVAWQAERLHTLLAGRVAVPPPPATEGS